MSVIAIALLAALNGGAAQGQHGPRVETRSEVRIVNMGGDGPGRLDADGDGVVTREEFSAPMGDAFDRLDANDDGRLSTEELADGHGEGGPGHRMMMMGGPGGPGVQVFTSGLRPGGPGGPGGPGVHVITREGGSPGVMMFGGPDGPGGRGGDVQVFTFRSGGPEGGPPPMGPEGSGSPQVFVHRFGGPDGPGEMDKDGDGKVSQDEFLAPLREAFGRMDADNDGFLEEGEGRPTPPPAD